MVKNIDPELLSRIKAAGKKRQVKAVIMLSQTPEKATVTTQGGKGLAALENAIKEVNEKPSYVQYLPKLGVIILKGSGRLISRVLDEPDVVSATIPEAEFTKEKIC